MEQYVGLDVSLEEMSICIMDRDGRILQRGVCATELEAIAAYVRRHAPEANRIVLETGQLSIWLTRELLALGLPVICVDARLAHKALSGCRNKSDRHDAEGLAHLARTGWFNQVQVKSRASDERRTLLGARDRTIRVRKDLEGHIRGVLKIFGIKLGKIAPGKERIGFRQRVHEMIDDDPMLRAYLYEAALTLLTRGTRFSPLKSWGLRLQQQKGFRKAAVAVARKLDTILFSMWRDNTEFQWSKEASMAA